MLQYMSVYDLKLSSSHIFLGCQNNFMTMGENVWLLSFCLFVCLFVVGIMDLTTLIRNSPAKHFSETVKLIDT